MTSTTLKALRTISPLTSGDYSPCIPGAQLLTDLEDPSLATHRHLVTMVHISTGEPILVDLATVGDGFTQLLKLLRTEFSYSWALEEILPLWHVGR